MWRLADAFDYQFSHTTVDLEVTTPERTLIFQGVSLQRALGSLAGLMLPLSGCPQVAFFRPMARFHLPLATVEETVYRASSMYLLGEWMRRAEGKETDFDLGGLTEAYKRVSLVNRQLHARLRGETLTDSLQNAVVLLDVLAQFLPMAVESSLEQVRPHFEAFLAAGE